MRLYNSATQARQNMVPMICDLQLPKTRDAVVAELAAIHNHLSGCASVAVNDGFFSRSEAEKNLVVWFNVGDDYLPSIAYRDYDNDCIMT